MTGGLEGEGGVEPDGSYRPSRKSSSYASADLSARGNVRCGARADLPRAGSAQSLYCSGVQ